MPFQIYTYFAPLPTNFSAAMGTQYWMSIVANLGYPPQWGWEAGTGGDGSAYQSDFGYAFPLSNDLTFSLAYTVPEPGSIALFIGMGLAGGLCVRRRKRASRGK